MSTTSITQAPPSTAATASPPLQSSLRWALARFEGRRLLTHPLFMLGMGCSALVLAVGSGDGGGSLERLAGYSFTSGALPFFGASLWTFLVAGLAVSRQQRDAAQDFYAGQPVAPRVRTQAALLSLGWAGLAAAALIAVAAITLAGFDGALVVEGERYALRPLELAQAPLYLVLAGALGVLVGTWTRRVYPVVFVALVLFFPPMAWAPWFVFGDGVPRGFYSDWLTGASVGWHLTGLAGLTVLAAAGALARHDRRPHIALLALAGLAATVAGLALGMAAPPPGGYWGS